MFKTASLAALDGWWVTIHVDDDEIYEGWLVDQIGDTIIIEVEPNKRHGVPWRHVKKLEAYRNRP